MLDLIFNSDGTQLKLYLIVRLIMVFVAWIIIVMSCFVDFWSGVSTAKALKQDINSHGFRKTLDKIVDYFKLALVGLMIDILGSLFPWYELTYGTILVCLAVVIVEGKSVVENTKRKRTGIKEIEGIAKDIIDAVSKKDALDLIGKISAWIASENKNAKWETIEDKKNT